MKRLFRIIALLMAALMVVTSCQAPDSSSQLSDGTVDVSFAGPSARTITTDDGLVQTVATSALWFQYKAVWQGEDPVPTTARNEWTSLDGPGLASTVKLHRGTWDLSLRAFVNKSEVGEDDKFILSGTLPGVAIGANNMVSQTVAINLGYVRQEGNGTLHISATYPVVYHEAANSGDSPVEAVRKVKVTANVAGTDYTGDITTFNGDNVGTLDLTVPAGAAHVTVQYYMDENTLFEGDQTAKDVLIMTTMTTNLAVAVDRDITAITFKAEQPAGTVEDNVLPKVFNSVLDIYPDRINDNEIVIGYAEEMKALGDQTPISYPYSIKTSATPDEQGRYKASDLGLVPITVTTRDALNTSGATEAWWGKTATVGYSSSKNTALASVRFVDGVTSIGTYAFYGCSGLTSITIPSSVTSIGSGAFDVCTGLTSITLPDSITEIGNSAFAGCTGLTNITIPSSVTSIEDQAFYGCSGLTSVTIPSSVTSIGTYTFRGCTRLVSVTILDGVTSIGEGAFAGCTGLTNVTIPNGVRSIGQDAFYGCTGLTNITIPSSVTSIGKSAFYGCSGLTDITIPSSITSIASGVFSDCTGLTSVTIPEGVTEIGSSAFRGCTRLTSVTIPEGVTSIGTQAFYGCTGLTSVTLPDSVTSIGQELFYGCTGLTSVTIPKGVTEIVYNAFYNCTSLTSITIPEGVTSIGTQAFYGCTGLANVMIPTSVTSIANAAFWNCTDLTSITIPEGVTSIEAHVFYMCTSLTSITIPDSVTTIGEFAFSNCTGLTSITIPDSVTSIEYNAFFGCTGVTNIYVNQAESTLLDNAGVPSDCTITWNSPGPESV